MIKKIVFSNAWSYYNKGDAAIAIATINKIHEILPDASKTLLAVDSHSFEKHKESFNDEINILPMVHTIPPFNIIFTIFSAISRANNALTSLIGILYLIIQLSLFPVFRRKKRVLENILTEIESADLIVAIGGNYLYSNKSFFNHILILVYGKFIKKKKIILLSHSIGPFNDIISSNIAKIFLNYMDAIIFRERLSSEYVTENITKRINYKKISGDAAFLFDPSSNSKGSQEPIVIAVSIRKWFFKSPYMFQKYLDTIIKIIISLIRKNYKIFLIPFSYVGTSENDVDVCNSVFNKIPDNLKKRVTILNIKDSSPDQIGNIMKEMNIDVLIATRLHSAILASIVNIPSVIISYQHFKAFGISKQLGLEDYIIKMSDVNYNKIMTMLDNLLENLEPIKNRLDNNVRKIRNETENDYDSIINMMDY